MASAAAGGVLRPRTLREFRRRQLQLEQRRYNDRRRRFIRNDPHLYRAHGTLQLLLPQIRTKMRTLQRVFEQRCREVWAHDDELRRARTELARMQRRRRRLERVLEVACDGQEHEWVV